MKLPKSPELPKLKIENTTAFNRIPQAEDFMHAHCKCILLFAALLPMKRPKAASS